MLNIEIKRFSPSKYQDLYQYIKKFWKPNHIFCKEKSIFNFQYRNNKKYNFLLAIIKNEILGLQGYIDYRTYDKKLKYNQIFLAFWSVKEKSPIGIGLLLHKKIINLSNPDFVGVVEVSNATHKAHKWLGFRVKLMYHHVFLSENIHEFRIAKVNSKKILNKKKINFHNSDYILLSKKNIYKLVDNFFYNTQLPTKSSKFIINRYLNHPIYDYLVYASLIDNKVVAIFVIRPINFKRSSVLRIVDYVGENKYFKTINKLATHLLDKYNSEYIDIYSHGIPKKIFKETNFIDIKSYKNLIIPNRFEPFIKKNFDIYCAYKTTIKDKNIKIFKADGDGDRPSLVD